MSDKSFPERLPYNVAGKFYVDEQCLDCDLCREIAPMIFARNDGEGTAFVLKQPETEEELKLARECLEGCPCEAIFDDGDVHDWNAPRKERPKWRAGEEPKPGCQHCAAKPKPWWKFWQSSRNA